MKKNMGDLDKIVRLAVVAVIVGLYFGNIVSGILGTILIIAAGVFTFTLVTSWCPLYTLFGLNTCKMKEN